ncbi:WhiB family transcriptional regulator [Bifidobacterium simiarum]|uniref:WhiB family transcriptional regulator n=1 Tax=Bifidobacterium simiarum TaxID=2045441 RepID=UPI0013FD3180|nr:WhiB family transcriptional regulator [Bifidobacterium simiarum]
MRWRDRLWTFEDSARDDPVDPLWRTVARRVCEECPVRRQCLADAIVDGVQWGLLGGLRRDERRQLAHLAEEDGVPVRDRSARSPDRRQRFRLLLAWLRAHPDAVESARDRVKARRHAEGEARRRRERGAPTRARPRTPSPPTSTAGMRPLF